MAHFRSIGDKRTTAGALHNLADVERQRGNYERAKALGMESISFGARDRGHMANGYVCRLGGNAVSLE